jgi:hypothetical protein
LSMFSFIENIGGSHRFVRHSQWIWPEWKGIERINFVKFWSNVGFTEFLEDKGQINRSPKLDINIWMFLGGGRGKSSGKILAQWSRVSAAVAACSFKIEIIVRRRSVGCDSRSRKCEGLWLIDEITRQDTNQLELSDRVFSWNLAWIFFNLWG